MARTFTKNTNVNFGTQAKNAAHQKLVREAILELSAADIGRFWPRNTGAALSFDKKRILRYGLKGAADIEGILRGGQHFEAEVKTGSAVQSPFQKAFEKMILQMGGVYLLVRSIDDVRSFIMSRSCR